MFVFCSDHIKNLRSREFSDEASFSFHHQGRCYITFTLIMSFSVLLYLVQGQLCACELLFWMREAEHVLL